MASKDKISQEQKDRKKRGPGDQDSHIQPTLTPKNRLLHVLRLQKTIGNQEVVTLLKKNQNQNTKNEQENTHPPGNNSNLPENVKAKGEELSGISLDKVKVHYNSEKPGELGAHAYTKGTEIHIGPGKEKYLAHETWHVVQQLQGRVQPTRRISGKAVNDNPSLEKEADAMGEKLTQGNMTQTETRTSLSPWVYKGGDGDSGDPGADPSIVVEERELQKELQPLQRKISITPEMYTRGVGVQGDEITWEILKEYVIIAILDDYKFVWSLAKSDKPTRDKMSQLVRTIQAGDSAIPVKIQALNDLIPIINDYITQNAQIYEEEYEEDRSGATIPIPNRKTRYATVPEKGMGYKHRNLQSGNVEAPPWGDDEGMWTNFVSKTGKKLHEERYETTDPRISNGNLPLQVLPWRDAKRFFPRPLINLIFDVRYQLESEGAVVIDERTPYEKGRQEKSPEAPGTLRSWHQDSHGVLPPNNFDADNIPPHAQNLHDDYERDSQSGAGSSIGEAITAPIGYAEYTGTGSNWEHNVKIVLDYNTKRVYLTLTHYQYWALIVHEDEGTYEFFNGGSQQLNLAQEKLRRDKGEVEAIWMSPWMEIEMPSR